MEIQMLYDSEEFVVAHQNAYPLGSGAVQRPVFEIVNKETCRMLVLVDGSAQMFEKQVALWREKLPDQAEVEALLDGLTQLTQYPLVIH